MTQVEILLKRVEECPDDILAVRALADAYGEEGRADMEEGTRAMADMALRPHYDKGLGTWDWWRTGFVQPGKEWRVKKRSEVPENLLRRLPHCLDRSSDYWEVPYEHLTGGDYRQRPSFRDAWECVALALFKEADEP